uniref:OO_Ba0013J05-OO_Ba0033A15.20 protein n=1 Tax=Solanum tuberosum TaxID=4113 RepID=M0ZS51_SOLTU
MAKDKVASLGDSIPLQSSAQQDEPIQQKNLNEAAEKIPTTTLCKKTKTYSRKLSPGSTSDIPSTSAFPTSCTPANEDRTEADIQVSAVTPISASDKDVEEVTVSPSLDNTRSKASDISQPPDCPLKFDNLEDFFSRVSGKIKCAQSLGFSADQSSPIDDKKSTTQKSTPSAEMLATAKGDIKRLLLIPSQVMLLPGNCSALSAALSVHAGAPDLSAERALALEKLKENIPHFSLTMRRAKKDQEEYYKKVSKQVLAALSVHAGVPDLSAERALALEKLKENIPHFSLTMRRAKKDQEEYYKKVSKQVLLIDELTKYQELYTNLKDSNDKLEYKISKLEARLKAAKTKREAIQQQQLSLAKNCSGKFNALDDMEAELPVLKEMKELADWDVARLEESLSDFKSKIIE